MSPSMDDVALHAGVAKSTVSLVLNGKPGVSPELQSVVLQAAQELGYQLPRRRTRIATERNTITVVHCRYERDRTSPGPEVGLYARYMEGVRAYVREQNVNLNFVANYDGAEAWPLDGSLLNPERHAEGLILMGPGARRASQLIQTLLARNQPAVVLSRNWLDLPVSTVSQDHRQQAQIALDYLIQQGHRRIGFIAREIDPEFDWFAVRLQSYQETIAALHGAVNPDWIAYGATGAEAVRRLLAHGNGLTAVLAVNDGRAVEALCALQEMGVAVPDAVSVIGLDNSVESPGHLPALTTVGFPHVDVGYLAADLVLRMLRDDKIWFSNVVVRSYLIERESCKGRP